MGNSEKESLAGKQTGYEIIVRREAQLETQDAFRYYEDKSDGLGFEFLRSLDASLQSVKRNPFAHQTIYKETRRVLLRKAMLKAKANIDHLNSQLSLAKAEIRVKEREIQAFEATLETKDISIEFLREKLNQQKRLLNGEIAEGIIDIEPKPNEDK